ncbi:hypothetical protein RIF29_28138 [Crotalaria pallida]|uniref:Uncharacterized protein n=1 Tax=Crotalaria pallida TaxID=3830 RepID=A0AAN9I134_CROPI
MMMMMEVEQGQRLWDTVIEVKGKAGMEVYKEEAKVHKAVRKQRVSESDRLSAIVVPTKKVFDCDGERE